MPPSAASAASVSALMPVKGHIWRTCALRGTRHLPAARGAAVSAYFRPYMAHARLERQNRKHLPAADRGSAQAAALLVPIEGHMTRMLSKSYE